MLVGRSGECARLDRLLADAKAGQSAVLLLRGAPGAGKTALLDYAAESAEGYTVVRAVGAEWEMELPFAGLHQLCGELLGHLDRLPPPRRDALETAFGLSSGAPPERFLISLAVLSLLSEAAERTPVLCLVDDVQWLDRSSAQTLAFVARRLKADAVVLLFAVREPLELDAYARLPQLRLEGLPDANARELLSSVIGAPLDRRVRERILAEARGNPLALLELPRALSPAEFAGGFGIPAQLPLESRIEATFWRRAQQLPAATQRLLLLAAAEPTGEPALLWRSAAELGIATDAMEPAVGDGMLELGARVAFRHPLLRSAIYRAATAEERQAVHRALAAGTDAETDPDRQVWHRAQAALGPDENVAADLERSAGRAQARGGLAAAAAFLQRAAALTLDPDAQARRSLRAAGATQLAGAPEEAMALLSAAADGPLEEFDGAVLQRLNGQIALDLRRGEDAVPLLLDAAKRLESLDPGLARETYVEALRAASIAGRLGGGMLAAAKAARGAPPRPGAAHPIDVLLDGLAVRFTDGYAASAHTLKRALVAVRDEGGRGAQNVRWPWIARRVAPDLFDDDTWHALATRNVQISRESGALAVLPLALNLLSLLRCFEGKLAAAEALLDEADEIADATGMQPIGFGRVTLAGFRGEERDGLALIEAGVTAAIGRSEGVVLTFGEHARAVLHNGLGQHAAALAPAQSAGFRDELMLSAWALPELVEAASRSGRIELADAGVERLAERCRAAGTELALGIEARVRALVSGPASAEGLYREAIDRLGRCRFALDLARAHLLYGEWLRREQRRTDAREQLRTAHEMFASMEAAAFAERARRELMATGETVRVRTPDTRDQLTAQEAQIARLARDGLSNPEIATRLFISPRTVQYHLRKVFAKLGINSRTQLHRALPDDPQAA
ncbi:helix-turn-helix transcriptional regulator [Candidatus Solirubrobacter pratensis]|uniref:helix-turn-helix transcriptional regulator n=1 Tax=Candidatus Solirubrobacter pratensis TaxID=1298857 RepID=UPI00041EB2E7|nr:LuxR family transcriptional regulator [Candidatus Solirubrobacter pratensis]